MILQCLMVKTQSSRTLLVHSHTLPPVILQSDRKKSYWGLVQINVFCTRSFVVWIKRPSRAVESQKRSCRQISKTIFALLPDDYSIIFSPIRLYIPRLAWHARHLVPGLLPGSRPQQYYFYGALGFLPGMTVGCLQRDQHNTHTHTKVLSRKGPHPLQDTH